NSSGASAGNGVEANSLVNGVVKIGNGGRWVHNTLRNVNGVVPLLSTVAGTENGEFEYDLPGTTSQAISTAGRIYGSLTLTSSAGARTYSASGNSAMTVRGNFRINTGITFS